jgi:hypothetical protein
MEVHNMGLVIRWTSAKNPQAEEIMTVMGNDLKSQRQQELEYKTEEANF